MSNSAGDTERASDSVRRRVLLTVIFTVFLDLVGFGIVIPLLPLYVTDMHASALMVGVLLSSFATAQLIATPILGRLSDRYGRRRIILLSLVGNAISMIVFALATHLSLLWLLFVSRMLAGATAGNLSACQAAIADVTSHEERTEAMGRIGAGIGLGLMVGPMIGGWLSVISPAAPPIAGAAMAVLDVILTALLMPETRPARAPAPAPEPGEGASARGRGAPAAASLWSIVREPRMASVLLLYFMTFLMMTNLQVSLGLLAQERMDWGKPEVGNAFGLFGFCGVIIQGLLIGRLVRALGEPSMIIIGAAVNVVGMLCIGLARTSPTLIAGLVLVGVGMAITNPSMSSLASKLARDENRGAALGFAQSAGVLARAIGPTWSGFLFARLGATAPFVGGALAALTSLLIGLAVRGSARAARLDAPREGAAGPRP